MQWGYDGMAPNFIRNNLIIDEKKLRSINERIQVDAWNEKHHGPGKPRTMGKSRCAQRETGTVARFFFPLSTAAEIESPNGRSFTDIETEPLPSDG